MSEDAKSRIRIKVVGVFRAGDRILVVRVIDPTNGRVIYVPPGGGVEFGEDTAAALRREMREELETSVEQVALLGVIENRFTYAGRSAHEIVFVYHVQFPESSRYQRENFVITECDGTRFDALWVDITAVGPNIPSICPDGLTELLKKKPDQALEPTPATGRGSS